MCWCFLLTMSNLHKNPFSNRALEWGNQGIPLTLWAKDWTPRLHRSGFAFAFGMAYPRQSRLHKKISSLKAGMQWYGMGISTSWSKYRRWTRSAPKRPLCLFWNMLKKSWNAMWSSALRNRPTRRPPSEIFYFLGSNRWLQGMSIILKITIWLV